jgi:F0F1-type ATP synthase assembly protein I
LPLGLLASLVRLGAAHVADTKDVADSQEQRPDRSPDIVPREFLRVLAVWSLIPAYAAAGAFLGWLMDAWLHTSPYGIGLGLVIALALAVRDMLRLRDELWASKAR